MGVGFHDVALISQLLEASSSYLEKSSGLSDLRGVEAAARSARRAADRASRAASSASDFGSGVREFCHFVWSLSLMLTTGREGSEGGRMWSWAPGLWTRIVTLWVLESESTLRQVSGGIEEISESSNSMTSPGSLLTRAMSNRRYCSVMSI